MEGAALNTPPETLDRIVRLLIPPAAREAVVGDLWETYQSPAQYAREALGTVPFVVFSQMRRHFNLPALMLQAILLYACIGPVAAALALPLLMLAEAYQPAVRPTPRRAMREAVALAFAMLIFLQAIWGSVHGRWAWSDDGVRLGLALFFVGPVLVPLLCLLRAGLIMGGDRRASVAGRDANQAVPGAEALAANRSRFVVRLRGARLVEAGALALAAIVAWLFLGLGFPGLLLALLFTATALFLVLDVPASGSNGDFTGDDIVTVSAGYQRLLTRHQRLRGYLWWLWCSPALLALHANALTIAGEGNLVQATIRGAAAIMLCFFVNALNREGAGWTQEQIGLLGRMRERLI